MATTIQLENEVKRQLDKIKNYKRETYNDVIVRMLKMIKEDEEELSTSAINNIKKSLEDIKHGRVYSHDEVKRRLNLK